MSVLLDAMEITVGGDMAAAEVYFMTHCQWVEPEGGYYTTYISRQVGHDWLWQVLRHDIGGRTWAYRGQTSPVPDISTARVTLDVEHDTLTIEVDGIEQAVYECVYHSAGFDYAFVTFDYRNDCWVSPWARAVSGDERVWNLHSVRDRIDWGGDWLSGANSARLDKGDRMILHGGRIVNAATGLPVWLYRSEATELTEVTL